jgi:hypothetical protein
VTITWSHHPRVDESNCVVFDVKVKGVLVIVIISEEAEEERGLPLCKALAERRLHHASIKGMLPQRLYVRTTDFGTALP